jgi:hypothetical protein
MPHQLGITIRAPVAAACHQVVVPAWYTAYPELSADNIENNAQIRAGLSGDMNPAQAERWLSLL